MTMQKHPEITRRRVQAFVSDQNLRGRVYPHRRPVRLSVYSTRRRIRYEEAMQGDYQPAQLYKQYGPLWSTHWFRVEIEIPADWAGQEVHLLWDSSSEACVWQDGQPMQGLAGTHGQYGALHTAYRLTCSAQGGEQITLYVEVACNGLFGIDPQQGQIGLLRQAEIAVFDREAWGLLWDLVIIADMARHLPPDSPRAGQALYAANAMVNACDLNDRRTWPAARAIAAEFFAAHNGDGQHNISAIGHAHIDTAWLWPLAETQRKCVRTFSTVLRNMEDYPAYRFACSQAQQYAWMKELHPALYEQISARVREGRFVPVGGTWVEPDTNIPSGESLVRQFLYGQRFFRQEFGITCREFWLPDTFGYSAALPQIMRGAGVRYFLSQKLSWNQFNKPASSTFIWEGLDGSRVLAHFPPADTYNGVCTVEEIVRSVRNYKDHERGRESLYPFGYGDGGGGPTAAMLEQLQRMGDVDGLPRVAMRSPQEFFERCEADIKDPVVWVGELYFEMHRATYTTQARNKLNNRRSEFLLHDVELIAALAHAAGGQYTYPAGEIERLWKLVLLNQFHDILPGSSIFEVYEDSGRQYADILRTGAALRGQALDALLVPASQDGSHVIAFNTLSSPRAELTELPEGIPAAQQSAAGKPLGIVSAPPMGYAVMDASMFATQSGEFAPVTVTEDGDTITLENVFVRATFRRDGHLISLYNRRLQREAIAPGAAANHFVLFDDEPLDFDAWDVDIFHLEKRWECGGATSASVVEAGPLRAAIAFEHLLSPSSRLRQVVSLTCLSPRLDFATEVNWNEHHRFLKVEFPLNIRAQSATYEIQFGHIERPTHFNTPWDLARFEVCAHRWADLTESGFGVALLNDCKYGHAVHGNIMRLSLLRAPFIPDPSADRGQHAFRYALLPHAGSFREAGVIEEGYRFNVPLLLRPAIWPADQPRERSFFSVSGSSAVIETVKRAEDSDALIVRLYEAHGGRGHVRLSSPLPVRSAARCNLLEEDDAPLAWANGGVDLDVRPFEIVTLKLGL